MLEFEKVMEGISRYIDAEMFSRMNDLQEFTARVLLGRFLVNDKFIKESLINNGYIRTVGIIDGDGMVDVDGLARDIKRELERKEKISFTVPMFGKLTFVPDDVNVLYKTITGKEMETNDYN